MHVVKGLTICCDVDDTLVLHKEMVRGELWNIDQHRRIKIAFDTGGTSVMERFYGRKLNFDLLPHAQNIEALREWKRNGLSIVVWSRGGVEWAETVVKALKLEDIVDTVMGKPEWTLDDAHNMGLPQPDWRDYVSSQGKTYELNHKISGTYLWLKENEVDDEEDIVDPEGGGTPNEG